MTAVGNRLLFKAATVPLQNYVRLRVSGLGGIEGGEKQSVSVCPGWSALWLLHALKHAVWVPPLSPPVLQLFFLAQCQTVAYIAIYAGVLAVRYR